MIEDSVFQHHLVQTHTISWTNTIIARRFFPSKVPIDKKNLPLDRFTDILCIANRIQSFSIHTKTLKNLDYLFQVIQSLQKLKVLQLEFINLVSRIPLSCLDNVFFRLEELSLRGQEYTIVEESENNQDKESTDQNKEIED